MLGFRHQLIPDIREINRYHRSDNEFVFELTLLYQSKHIKLRQSTFVKCLKLVKAAGIKLLKPKLISVTVIWSILRLIKEKVLEKVS